MFKSKGTVYILIPLNILIWGFFIYRFYTAYNEGDIPVTNENIQVIKLDDLKDSVQYQLSLNYKDPFLREGENNKKTHSSGTTKTNEQKPQIVKTPTVVTPKITNEIKYLGLVKNNSTGVSTALVSINGKSYLVKKGDVIEGVTIKNISNDNVEIKEGKNSITVSKN